ncbi:MAG: hypothetical protein KA761_09835 [Gemmatimonadaceae bacterium]|nr:hypothetical protein [Gemmatimonadaceae bacterium]
MASSPLRPLALTFVVVFTLAGACYTDPKQQLDQMQETLDLQATLEDLANRTTELQFATDSLRGVVARQDSTLRRLANLAGVVYP